MKRLNLTNTSIIALLLALLISCSGCDVGYGTDTVRNDAPFYPDRVVNMEFLMSDDDWKEMKRNPGAEAYAKADMWYDGELVPDVALRPKGNSSLRQAISGGSIKFGLKVDINFFNSARHLDNVKKLNFSNGFSDPTFVREMLSYEIFKEMGLPTPRTAFVDIWVNEDHLGLYTMVEQIDATFLETHFSNPNGYLYKPHPTSGGLKWTENLVSEADITAAMASTEDVNMGGAKLQEIMDVIEGKAGVTTQALGLSPRENGDVPPRQPPGNQLPWPPPPPGGITANNNPGQLPAGLPSNLPPPLDVGNPFPGSNRNYLLQMGLKTNEENPDYTGLFTLLEVLNNTTDEAFAEQIGQVLDVDQALRFLAVSDAIVHLDNYIGMGHNYYLYEVDGKFTIIPWDLNMAFGTFNAGLDRDRLVNYYIDEPSTGKMAERPLLRLLEVPEYLETYHDYLRDIINSPLALEEVNTRIDDLANMIRPYVIQDELKFFTIRQFEISLETDTATSKRRGGGGMSAYGLKSFIRDRAQSITAQLGGEVPTGPGDGSGNGGSFTPGNKRPVR